MARNRNPKVAAKINARKSMNRAWQIAKNAHNSLIADPVAVAKQGVLNVRASDFFQAALKIAWEEIRTGRELYTMNGSLPRKVLPRIESQLRTFVKTHTREIMETNQFNFLAARVVLNARFGNEKVTQEMINEISVAAYGETKNEQLAMAV